MCFSAIVVLLSAPKDFEYLSFVTKSTETFATKDKNDTTNDLDYRLQLAGKQGYGKICLTQVGPSQTERLMFKE